MYIEFAILMLISLAPIVLLLWYFDHLDKAHKESRRFLWKIFLWGVFITIIAGAAEFLILLGFGDFTTDKWVYIFVVSFVFIALVEEGLKFWVVKKKAYPHPAFNEYYDGVIYAVVASLGFAALENILYVMTTGLGVGIIRALLSVPAHALFGVIMGYYFSLARFSQDKQEQKNLLSKALIYPVALHGLYNFLLMSGEPILVMLVFPLLLGLYLNAKRKINHLHVMDGTDAKLPAMRTADYVRTGIGMMFFTVGSMLLFATIIYTTEYEKAQALLMDNFEFNVPVAIIMIIAVFLLSARIINWDGFKKGWMTFAHGLGVINTAILLSAVYFVVVGIYAVIINILKLIAFPFRKKPDSYWVSREHEHDIESFKHPF